MKKASEIAFEICCPDYAFPQNVRLCAEIAQAITEARREGMEEAAKVADMYYNKPVSLLEQYAPNLHEDGAMDNAMAIAEAIRAKAKEIE